MFLSHPIEENKCLADHCITVAQKTKEILDDTRFEISDLGFYAGLLHDIGKLNPFYQILFFAPKELREKKFAELQELYLREHSRFSAWASNYLLEHLDYNSIDTISIVIASHHTRLAKTISQYEFSDKLKKTQDGMYHNLELFEKETVNTNFAELTWQNCYQSFKRPIRFHASLEDSCTNTVEDYVKIGMMFSALLQADRGSFSDWQKPNYDIKLDTSILIKSRSILSSLRSEFAQYVMTNYDYNDMKILEAPTGIGKTKIFLDLIAEYEKKFNLERVFYFSPLLALTDDFESKMIKTVSESDLEYVLSYNHLFSGSLEQKKKFMTGEQEKYQWIFADESFNQKFVITTTQRLLMTLYSNSHSDKLKLASLKNSLLIIDEIQTIPKFLIPSLLEQLDVMCNKMGTKIILVSATVPHEMASISRVNLSDKVVKQYLEKTKKNIVFSSLSISDFANQKTLVMANTRKKASAIFVELENSYPENNMYYLSTGIRKQDRLDALKNIDNAKECICVSTQVVEAGVDISFSQIYREVAPLDNIVQVMGRLNREGNNTNALLTVFQYDQDWKPYSRLEFEESIPILKKISSSLDLYKSLPEYYKTIHEKNEQNSATSRDIINYMKKMDYQQVWDIVYSDVFAEEGQETVFVPKSEEMWHEFKNSIMSAGKITKTISRKFSYYTASLGKSPEKLGILDKFDTDLLEKNILLPKIDEMDDTYDSKIGLDKWLK